MAKGHDWRSAWELAFAIALKPLAITVALLAAVTRPSLGWRLILAGLVMIALPFAFGNFSYVAHQYQDFYKQMTILTYAGHERFCDLGGLLAKLGILPSDSALMIIRAITAVVILAVVIVASRRFEQPVFSLLLFSLGVSYLMLMNPRTEANAYVILAPAVAAFATIYWREPSQKLLFWFFVFIDLALATQNYSLSLHRWTNLWLKPLLALIFCGYLVCLVLKKSVYNRPDANLV
jgi:alpha-1,2-mannosyltransferase